MAGENRLLLQKLKNLECRDSTFLPCESPLVLDRAQGSTMWDIEGNKYLDLCAGFGSLPFGHNPPFFAEILQSSAQSITHGLGDVYPSKDKIELLETLKDYLPSHLAKGALALTGSQAVEIALKTAMLATGKFGFISCEGSYHGLDLGTLSVTSRKDFKEPFSGFLRKELVEEVPFSCSMERLEQARKNLRSRGVELAAILVEPVQGRAGVRFSRDGWLAELREYSQRAGALLIFDEIWVGFGRSGVRFFSSDVPADLVTVGKALGSGMPVSACFGTDEVMQAWPESRGEALHTGTFFGHPLSCRVARRCVEEMKAQKIEKVSSEKGAIFLEKLRRQDFKTIRDVRGQGMMIALEFTGAGTGAKVMDELRKFGVVAIPSGEKGDVLSLTPALNFDENLMDDFIDRLQKSLKNLFGE